MTIYRKRTLDGVGFYSHQRSMRSVLYKPPVPTLEVALEFIGVLT